MTFVERYSKMTGLSNAASKRAVKDFVAALKESLDEEGNVRLNDFGTIKIVNRAARTAYNPATGSSIHVPEKKAVKFVAAKALKETL